MNTNSRIGTVLLTITLLCAVGCTKHHTLDDRKSDGGTDTGITGSDGDSESDSSTETDGGPVTLVADDPAGDATSFSFVFSYLNQIWFGPNGNGTGAAYLNPEGNGTTQVSFSFTKDDQGNTHRNSCASCDQYNAVGSSTCSEDTPLCGPDNEDGRGLFTSGTIAAEPWLILTGAFQDDAVDPDLNYIYVTQDSTDPLSFYYVDINEILGPRTMGCSAMHVFHDRVYLGFPDAGGKRPYLATVLKMPTASPGLDAQGNGIKDEPCDPGVHDACSLMGHLLPGIGGSAPTSMIDSITDFGDRLYVANNGGLVRSTRPDPLDAANHLEHWKEVTPSNAAYQNLDSITTNKTTDIEPKDKAIPAMLSFRSKLYLARNTTQGPQLWSCAPQLTESTTDCDSGDWELLAPNNVGNTRLTQFNNTNNSIISLLIADEQHLYVGFDNSSNGLVIFRTSEKDASDIADFVGLADCTADHHPSECAGVSGNGFGSRENSRIYSAAAVKEQGKSVFYFVVGNGTSPAKVYAIK